MAHIVKCRICKRPIDIDVENDWVRPVEKMYYHKTCYEDFAKKKGAIKAGDLKIEGDDELWLSAVYDYLTHDVKMRVDYPKLISQWKNLLKAGRTAKGIYFTLRYFYEVEHGDAKEAKNGIGIVSHVYDRAAEYWCNRNAKDKGICDRIEAQIREFQKREVKTIMRKEEYKPKIKVYSFEEIEGSEEDDG